jgi:hypothetical protein
VALGPPFLLGDLFLGDLFLGDLFLGDLALQQHSLIILRESGGHRPHPEQPPKAASRRIGHKRSGPSFETPRKRAAAQDEG